MKLTMKAARVNRGLTQKELAEKLGISREWYMQNEQERVKPKEMFLLAFCYVLDIDRDDLNLKEDADE